VLQIHSLWFKIRFPDSLLFATPHPNILRCGTARKICVFEISDLSTPYFWAKQPLRFKIDEDEGAKGVGLSAVVFWKRDLDFTLGSGISFLLEVSSVLMIIKLTFFNFRLRSG
jgi:hypothetical protein